MTRKLTLIITAICLIFMATQQISEAQTMQNNPLTVKQQNIVIISAFTASGDLDKLAVALNDGLDAGLTVNEIKEVLVQLYAYAGFPRSLNAVGIFMTVLDDRKVKGIKDTEGSVGAPLGAEVNKFEFGKKVQTELVGAPVAGAMYDFAPAVDLFLKEHLFADIFGRGVLSRQDRELATVAALSNISGVNPQLQAHFNISMNTGLTEAQMKGLITVLDSKVGKTQGANAADVYNKVLKSRK